MTGRRIVGGVLLVVAALVVAAPPAVANHRVEWGAGHECGATSHAASTTVDTPVAFRVCVTLGGAPLPDHEMTVRVVGPTRSVGSALTTGPDGTARFSIQPTAAGKTTVTLCDADGCVYGQAVITVAPASTSTSTTATTEAAPATTATTTETSTTASSTTDEGAAAEGHDGGLSGWVLLGVPLLVMLLVGLVALVRRRFLTSTVMIRSAGQGASVDDDGGVPIQTGTREHPLIRPIIFVPGIMASALRIRADDGTLQQVWPPLGFDGDIQRCLQTLQLRPGRDFEIDMATGDGLLDGTHAGLIRTLNGHGYKREGDPPNLYIYPYNWMQPCADAGAGLAELIAKVEEVHHGVPASIVCHSMGGLVVRAAWHLHGARSIHKVMYIGSPHLGAPMAYFVLHPDIPYSFLGGSQGDLLNAAYAMSVVARARNAPSSTVADIAAFVALTISGDTSFDSILKMLAQNATGVFELLPDEQYFTHVNPRWPVARRLEATKLSTLADARDLLDMVWVGTGRGDSADVPQPVRYTRIPSTWADLYLDDPELRLPGSLHPKAQEAMAFKAAINGPLPPEDGSRTMIVHGATQPTMSTADFSVFNGDTRVVLSGAQGGDGTVPTESGRGQPLWAGSPQVVIENGSEHFRLTEQATVHALVRQFFPHGGRY